MGILAVLAKIGSGWFYDRYSIPGIRLFYYLLGISVLLALPVHWPVFHPAQRLASGTPLRADSLWAPQPAQVACERGRERDGEKRKMAKRG